MTLPFITSPFKYDLLAATEDYSEIKKISERRQRDCFLIIGFLVILQARYFSTVYER